MNKHIPILDIHRSARKIHSQERLALPERLPENGRRFGHGKTDVGVFDIFSSGCVRDASRNTRFESRTPAENFGTSPSNTTGTTIAATGIFWI